MDTKVADPLRGALLGGRYRITERLARGGTTTVYHARDERLDRPVAIRIINPEHAIDHEVIDRLANEAQTVAHLAHPNIIAIYDQGSHEGAAFLVMEYVRGRTLREILAERGRLDPAESLAIVEQVLAALTAAHRNGLVHRAIRPENILVAAPPSGSGDLVDAVVKVADFGLASATAGRADLGRSQAGPMLAVAPYLAPEQITGGRVDPRTDVYSTGIVLFEMLAGRVPFVSPTQPNVGPGRSAADIARYPGGLDVDDDPPVTPAWRHVDEEVPSPSRFADDIPLQLDDIVMRATRRDPAVRHPDAAAMLAEIQAAREEVGALATRMVAQPTVAVPLMAGDHTVRLPARPAAGRAVPSADGRPPGLDDRFRDLLGTARGWLQVAINRLLYTTRGRRQITVAVVVLGVGLIVGGWWLGAGRYVQAPDLRGMTQDNAVAEAERLGFSISFGQPIYSEDVPADTVLNQAPLPGGRIVRGGTITVYLSLGPERYTVPDLVGQAANFATTRIPIQILYTLVDGYSDSLPVGYVAAIDPPAGTILAPGDSITITVVKGPFPAHVPSVVGRALGDAQDVLSRSGFRDIEVQHRDDDRPKDTVIEQTPAAGTGVASAAQQKITLVVSNGPELAMPDVFGFNCLSAMGQLQGMGLNVVVAPMDPPIGLDVAVVLAQDVPAGAALLPGQTVNLTCGPQPPPPPEP